MIKQLSKYLMLLLCKFTVAQQTTYVLTQNDDKLQGTVNIKWYTPALVQTSGVNVYRKEGSETWLKLNGTPLVFGSYKIPDEALLKDKELGAYLSICAKPENIKGLVFTAVLLKSFRNTEFSKYLGIFFDDQSALSGHTYSYKITQINPSDEITLGVSKEITVGPKMAADPPNEIKYLQGRKQVNCSWISEPLRYFAVDIYRKDSVGGTFNKINQQPVVISSTNSKNEKNADSTFYYRDCSIRAGNTYSYYMQALDFFGGNSRPSAAYTISVSDYEAPAAPFQLNAQVKGKSVLFTWKHNREEKDLKGFNIYRTNKNDTDYTRINKTDILKTIQNYADSVSHFGSFMYKVSAIDNSGNERFSNPTLLEIPDTEAPQLPAKIKIKSDSGLITLSWQPGKESDLAGYLIYRSIENDDADDFVKLTPKPVKSNAFVDHIPFNSKNRFVYKLVAVDSSYNRSLYSSPLSIYLPDLMPPSPPLLTRIIYSEAGVKIEWLKNPEPDLKDYRIFRRDWTDSAGKYLELKSRAAPKDQSATDKIKQSGLQEYYLIATDSAGNRSMPSNHLRILFPSKLNEKPKTHIQLDAVLNERKKNVELKWKAELPEELMTYVLYRRTSLENCFSPLSGATLDKNFADTQINGGMQYIYQLRAYTKSGEIHRSETISITVK